MLQPLNPYVRRLSFLYVGCVCFVAFGCGTVQAR